ncbi:MAG: DNA repair protein RecN [Armatimonadota bacterium]|nr:DNA repair protein RecN [Armatimonadota bacterium]
MLSELTIQDLAIIDRLHLRFSPGFNVLTGETGAGKSIIIDAINAILGGRVGTELVRTGAPRAVVEAAFDISASPAVTAAAQEAGCVPEDGLFILSREISASGKSQCRINGKLASVSMLRDLGRHLVDVHGQHEHQSLLVVNRHVDLLDAWAGPEVLALRSEVAELAHRVNEAERQALRLEADERDRARRIDLLQFQIQEIDAARLQPGEEEELEADRARLANAEKLHLHAQAAYECLKGDGNALDRLAECVAHLEQLAAIDRDLLPLLEAVRSAYYQLDDAGSQLRAYGDSIEFNPQRLEQVQERLQSIALLRRKYGDSIPEILAYRAQSANELEELTHYEERRAQVLAEQKTLREKAEHLAGRLSEARRSAARRFEQAVEDELASVAMRQTRFSVAITPQPLGTTGADRVEFLISPNPGEPLKPLARIASGGEMSRIMLALKAILASVDQVPTLIFDEIDAGVGGRAAGALGEKLASLGREKQVICVTHLAPIASRANAHFSVHKEVQGERTVVRMRRLSTEERVDELVRMLGGGTDWESARRHAQEMLTRPASREDE